MTKYQKPPRRQWKSCQFENAMVRCLYMSVNKNEQDNFDISLRILMMEV